MGLDPVLPLVDILTNMEYILLVEKSFTFFQPVLMLFLGFIVMHFKVIRPAETLFLLVCQK